MTCTMFSRALPRPTGRVFIAIACMFATAATLGAGALAQGTIAYKAKSGPITIAPKFAYLVKGPDAVDAGNTIRKLIFSTRDWARRSPRAPR